MTLQELIDELLELRDQRGGDIRVKISAITRLHSMYGLTITTVKADTESNPFTVKIIAE